MNRFKILIVDDEVEICRFLEAALRDQDYSVESVINGQDALASIGKHVPDIIILDLGLPDIDGKDAITKIRGWSDVPIIILSARDQEMEKVEALERGADDYLTKPFSVVELMARLKVMLRRLNKVDKTGSDIYSYLGLDINLTDRRVVLNGEPITLTPTEYKLLAALAKQPGRVLTQNQLIHEVWGNNAQGNSHYLRIYVQHVRKKLKDDPLRPRFIMTDAGIGYRLSYE